MGLRRLLEQAGLEIQTMRPQGGHFMFVAQQLHYTCRVLESFTGGSFKKLLLKLASLISRLLFGLVTKAIALWLDKRLMLRRQHPRMERALSQA